MAGLYLHIPFCAKKCTYCNFYSACAEKSVIDDYLSALKREIEKWGGSLGRPIETLYIGGGTPSVLGEKIAEVIECVRENFNLKSDCEITAEMNPTGECEAFMAAAKQCGVNRLSIGLQSANTDELKVLGRTHTANQAAECVRAARRLGFSNISLDLMLGLPESNTKTLEESLNFITDLDVEHISAYILRVEEKTALSKMKLSFLDDDKVAEQYLFLCEYLEKKGYSHYEISNFSKSGFESRHNTKYWLSEEYLGIGASAHSFLDGKRFFYDADLRGFIKNPAIIDDGTGGDYEEYFMLALRLKTGIDIYQYEEKFGLAISDDFYKLAELLKSEKLVNYQKDRLWLTDKGMLLSNTIITEFLERII